MMEALFMFFGALSAAAAVLLGGLRAHVLTGRLNPERLAMLDVGTRYQLVHALAIILVALLLMEHWHTALLATAGWAFVAGTLLLPCMLYAYAFTGRKPLVKLTMLGGACLVTAWL